MMDSHLMASIPAPDLDWLALTKLAPPAPRPDLLARPRLFDALRQALATCPLTLISAPAGSGKTTLLVDWLKQIAECRLQSAEYENQQGNLQSTIYNLQSLRVAWVSLDEGDDDPARFFAALSVGLQRSGLSNLLPPEGGAPEYLRLWLTRLINTLLTDAGRSYVLILDDLHWISDPAIFAALDQFIERMPPQLRLIAATRHDPPLGLARLRVRRQLAELHLSDLRFTADETAKWLNSALQLDVPVAQIASLVDRTEGWAAGISLLASSLEQIRSPADRAAFLDHVRRTDRTLFEFLAEEVLNRQDPFVRMFLLETAVLPNLTPTLCQAVTGRADAEALLDALYRRNLFLVALDDHQPPTTRERDKETRRPGDKGTLADHQPISWSPRLPVSRSGQASVVGSHSSYRYHDLFRDFLRDRLRRELPDWPTRLYRRAAAAETDPLRRIRLYLSGELWADAAQAIAVAGETLVHEGAFGLLQRWIAALPTHLREADPQLLLLNGICAWEAYQLEAGRPLLLRALRRFEELGDQAGRATALARLTIAAHYTGDFAAARDFAAQALSLPLAPELQVRLQAIRSLDLLQSGGWRMALDDLDQVIGLIEQERLTDRRQQLIAALQLYMPGPLMPLPGAVPRFERIERLRFQQPLADTLGPLRLYLLTIQIYIHLERGQWDIALAGCAELYRMSEQLGVQAWNTIAVGGVTPICLASRGDMAAADAALDQLFVWIARVPHDVMIQRIPYLFWRARIRWLQGQHDEVRALYEQIVALEQTYGAPPFVAAVQPLLHGLIAIGERRYDDAERMLQVVAEIQDRVRFSVIFSDAHLLLAFVALKRGRIGEALSMLAPLLAEHEQADTPGRLMWEGAPAAALLRLAVEHGCHAAFAQRVLRLLEPAAAPPAASPPKRIALPGSDEALSMRELEVLHLMAEGASNTEIAERLIISPHTAKRHVANILGKLGAATRTEAAARARDLGLT
jgi:LuxR family transcriptional regulator, maltose regulon positive regulatory protein